MKKARDTRRDARSFNPHDFARGREEGGIRRREGNRRKFHGGGRYTGGCLREENRSGQFDHEFTEKFIPASFIRRGKKTFKLLASPRYTRHFSFPRAHHGDELHADFERNALERRPVTVSRS